ncbi:hypothetical protein [Aestuariivivens sediminis]|nr:hypothetical protein [Aestuariivivens sediminis]
MSKREVAFGIDIGGTHTKMGFVPKAGKVIFSASFSTGAKKPFLDFENK